MKFKLDSPDQLGKLVRATRKHQAIRQDLFAEMLGVSENFMGRLENGADTMQWGKLFGVLEALGIKVIVDLPDGAAEQLALPEKKNRQAKRANPARRTNSSLLRGRIEGDEEAFADCGKLPSTK
ncbi:helix-turn-helix domain-containing protein [Chromobacterium sphagni]|uniref:Uncharacterized protein n=1 Tax=Chromobacterium sphagni TaxID=1903179 RepID=A0A1S1X288_9NEIS|nr:helix-turn-helix domain-containing protein [Chromobacterium sphagni]OHX13458.1 hypothetical protein BI347_07975 [Chromobacterium sphagni]OHX21911.1 hypothetical protein BI344_05265 [Chromobacterium sphagni]